jgi:hypothetical protein
VNVGYFTHLCAVHQPPGEDAPAPEGHAEAPSSGLREGTGHPAASPGSRGIRRVPDDYGRLSTTAALPCMITRRWLIEAL